MKLVTLVIHPSRLEQLKKTLWEKSFRSFTVSAAEGMGLQKGILEKDGDFVVAMAPRLRVEVAVKDSDAEILVEVALESLRTGRVGDGKIFVSSLEQVVRVRTGERGDTAL
jgi:nitrogen regulatory protein PII